MQALELQKDVRALKSDKKDNKLAIESDKKIGLLKEEVAKKDLFLKDYNQKKRPETYPEFSDKSLIRKNGEELTSEIRENIDGLIEEAKNLCALKGGIPEQQIRDLKDFVSKHRFFMSPMQDHDRSRIEFDINKNQIISNWEKAYKETWPKYNENVYCNGKMLSRAGKPVSRHHFFPVRIFTVEDNPIIDKAIKNKVLDVNNVHNLNHYDVNASWNMIPSEHPGEHVEGIHGDNSLFTKIFGPIKEDYHYLKTDPNKNNLFKPKVPKKFHSEDIPLYVKQYDYFLSKLEEKTQMPIPYEQRNIAIDTLTKYVKEFPNNTDLKSLEYEEQMKYMKTEIFQPMKFLIRRWEINNDTQWPKDSNGRDAKPTFLIPPFFKANKVEWWMIHPDLTEENREKRENRKMPNIRSSKERF